MLYGHLADYEQELPASAVSSFSTAAINPATHPWHHLVETQGAQLNNSSEVSFHRKRENQTRRERGGGAEKISAVGRPFANKEFEILYNRTLKEGTAASTAAAAQ